MLSVTRKPGQNILVFPSPDIDPDMTVSELFKDGPIRIRSRKAQGMQLRITVDAPRELKRVKDS